MKRSDEPPADESPPREKGLGAVDALTQLSFLVQGALEELAATLDLSLVQARLLGILRDRSPAMNELARYLELDKSSVTGLVDRAERRGLVRRKVSSADRRAIDVSITPAGRKLVARAEVAFGERIGALVGVLSAAERANLAQLASRIVIAEAQRRGIDLADGRAPREE